MTSTPSPSTRLTRYWPAIRSPSLTRKRSPNPEMIAVRVAPSDGESDERERRRRRAWRPRAARASGEPVRTLPHATRARRTETDCAPVPAADPSAAAVRGDARFRRPARRPATRCPSCSAWSTIGAGRRTPDVVAPAIIAASTAPAADSVAVRLMFIAVWPHRSTRAQAVCYYSSCTLHRLASAVDITPPPLEVVAVIPARFASTRFPGKALADIDGRPMIEHVYRRAAASPARSRASSSRPTICASRRPSPGSAATSG